ncbi:MAG: hypothetical protein MI924_38350 [Chloroflexales bacterium]|nr:hypothetical protein [Chloroflexales bacterium]
MNRTPHILIITLFLLALPACSGTSQPAAPVAAQPAAPGAAQPATAVAKSPHESWPSEFFLARPEGAKGRAIAYDMADGSQRFSLPNGMLAADHTAYYAASVTPKPQLDVSAAKQSVPAFDLNTRLDAYDPQTGELVRSFDFDGAWELSGVAPSGRWLALTRSPSAEEQQERQETGQWQTKVNIVQAEEGRVVNALVLDGNFEVETISADGSALFLVQHLPAVKPDHYLIRLYDLAAERLQEDPLRDKQLIDEVMSGYAWDGLASPNGQWLLTLYLSTNREVAFIHTLDLWNKAPTCIDLPSGDGDIELLKYYTLALDPNSQTVYAANTALGVIAEVSLHQRKLVRATRFDAQAPLPTDAHLQATSSRSVTSPDGRTLYFSNGTNVWAYDTKERAVSGPYQADGQITGLGVSSDGKRLYVAQSDQLLVFDTASGEVLKDFDTRIGVMQ